MWQAYAGIAALELAGGYFASQNIREAARINKMVSDLNAQYAELDAFDALAEGQSQQARYQSVIDATLSQQNAIIGASGADANYGSLASVIEESNFNAEMNLMEIEKQAQEKALGIQTQGRHYRQQGEYQYAQAKAQSRQVLFNSALSAGKTGLTGYKLYLSEKKNGDNNS